MLQGSPPDGCDSMKSSLARVRKEILILSLRCPISLRAVPVTLQAIPSALPALVNPTARALAIAKRGWLTFPPNPFLGRTRKRVSKRIGFQLEPDLTAGQIVNTLSSHLRPPRRRSPVKTFTAGDFNSDGATDFIVWYFTAPPYHPFFAILKGNGDGTFQHETTVKFPDTFEELGIVAGDFNSDGLLDFVMLPNGGGVRVYTQK
jgi:FG-GAP-like repeat